MKRLTQKKHFAEPQHDEAVLDDHCLQPADQQPHEVIKDFHVQNKYGFILPNIFSYSGNIIMPLTILWSR